MAQQSGYGIEDIYRGVVSDVITQVREAFLDEGVDVDVLQQLKKSWEAKVNASGAVDLEGHSNKNAAQQQQQQAVQTQPIPPPALRNPPPTNRQPQQRPTSTSARLVQANAGHSQNMLPNEQQQQLGMVAGSSSLTVNQQQLLSHQQQQQRLTAMAGQTQQQQHNAISELNILQQSQQQAPGNVPLLGLPAHLLGVAGTNPQLQPPAGLRLLPGTQYAIMDGPDGTQNLILLATAASSQMNSLGRQPMQFIGGGQQQNVRNTPVPPMGGGGGGGGTNSQQLTRPTTAAMKSEPGGGGQVPQLDGGGEGQAEPGCGSQRKATEKTRNNKLTMAQLDGGRGKAPPGMTDESSEEEEERDEEEDPTLSAIKYGLEEEEQQQKEGEAAEEEEEEPLNSGDDQSDDEDLETLFDSDNVVVCQFEKVHRARNKWKFILKDGVMHLRDRDFCFQKCTGEAEW